MILGFILSWFVRWNNEEKSDLGTTDTKDQVKSDQQGAGNKAEEPQNRLRPIDDSDHVWGDKNAPVQLIVYSDFECPFCAQFTDTLKEVEKEFAGKVAIAFRHFPLAIHPEAMPAALASECASEQGKFWEMHDKLFADNKAGDFNTEQFKKDAADLGLDAARFNQCLDTEKYKDKILGQMLEGRNLSITGTPTIFINGEVLPGAYPFEDFKGSDGQMTKGVKSTIEKYLK